MFSVSYLWLGNKYEKAVRNTSVVEANEEAGESEQEFPCLLCYFVSNWANGLKVHMTRKHPNIVQIDGNHADNEDVEDEKYSSTDHYWKTGYLGTIFQTFLDAKDILKESDLLKETKAIENDKIVEARKRAFGPDFKYYPPWT